MKNKLITSGIVAGIILGGALGVSAFEGKSNEVEAPKAVEEVTNNESPVKQELATESQVEQKPVNKTPQQQISTNERMLSIDEVIEIVEKKFSAVVTEIDVDEEDGRMIYEIELYNKKEKMEIELDVDAYTAEVLTLEKEYEDDKEGRHELVSQKKQAIKTALSTVDGNIVNVDYDDDQAAFEIAVKSKDGVTIVTINKNNEIVNKTTESYHEYFND